MRLWISLCERARLNIRNSSSTPRKKVPPGLEPILMTWLPTSAGRFRVPVPLKAPSMYNLTVLELSTKVTVT